MSAYDRPLDLAQPAGGGPASWSARLEGISKNFQHIEALRGVDLEINGGQVLAIVGDNGAGKSTLIKILSGVLKPDRGRLLINGAPHAYLTPRLAGSCGISTVYQDLALVNTLNVWENIFLGHEYRRFGMLRRQRMRRESTELLRRLGIEIKDQESLAGNLSGGQRQAIAVARALHQGGKLFIFDEPTAAMGYRETQAVQRLIKGLSEKGYAVIMISHNIQQVYDLADRICVMRQGRVVATVARQASSPDDIVAMIVSGCAAGGAA